MKTIQFKTVKESLNYLLNEGDLWDEKDNKHVYFDGSFKTDGCGFDFSYLTTTKFYTQEPLQDKDSVYAWDNINIHIIALGFWDAKNNCLFCSNGKRYGDTWDNYEKIPRDKEPEWMTERRKTLED